MLELGIFARTFRRPTLDETLAAASASGFSALHFNFTCAGLPALPSRLEREQCVAIHDAFNARGLRMLGVSATYNTVHPDRVRRAAWTSSAVRVIEFAPTLGAPLVSLCTGTRNPNGMWQGSPGNQDPSAWDDLLHTLEPLVSAAEGAGVALGIEPERHNVISSAPLARRLLDEVASDALVVLLDPANLVDPTAPEAQYGVLSQAFDLLAERTIMVHAKDVTSTGSVAAGLGILDYRWIAGRIRDLRPEASVVLHEVAEPDVPRARAFVAKHLVADARS